MKLFFKKNRVVKLGNCSCRSLGKDFSFKLQLGRSSLRRWSRAFPRVALEGERKRVKI